MTDRELYQESIQNAKRFREIKSSGDLNLKVKKVCVLLSSSRSGSSLLKTVLSKSNDFAYLAGEEEPYYILSQNGFPFNSSSDEIKNLDNKQYLLDCIFDELGVNCSRNQISLKSLQHKWKNRLLLQSSQSPFKISEFLNIFNEVIADYLLKNSEIDWNEINQILLYKFFGNFDEMGYYDIIPENTPFISNESKFKFKIEEPPFVIPSFNRNITEQDLNDKYLFFKTPQNCYRIGIFEEMFPNAEIKYIYLSRGFAQTVNGLMDGWLSETGFFAHNMSYINESLNIKGYSDKVRGADKWWNFDLPPNWKNFKNSTLEKVCLNQWISAHDHIIKSNVNPLRIKFEDFLDDNNVILDKITNYLDINPIKVKKLPVVMATNSPSNFRWKKRHDIIMKLSKQSKVKELMEKLGYSMDPNTWK